MKRGRTLLPLLALVGLGLALFASGALERFDLRGLVEQRALWQARIQAQPLLAGLLHIAAMATAIATGLPGGLALVLGGGLLFGTVVGTLLSTLGALLGGLVLFFAGRHAFASGKAAPALAARLRAGFERHPFPYALLLRLIPLFPFGAVTLALAWLRCTLPVFVVTTAVGGGAVIALQTALAARVAERIGAGERLSLQLLADPATVLPLLALAALVLIPVLINRCRHRRDSAD